MKPFILSTLLLSFLSLNPKQVKAFALFDDGGFHLIDSSSPDIIVANAGPQMPTTVQIVDGAIIGTDPIFDISVDVFNTSLVEIFGGFIENDVEVNDRASINVFGGTLADDVQAFNRGTFNLFGGSVLDDIEAFQRSTINLFGGSFAEDIEAFDNAMIFISGGILGAGGSGGETGIAAFDTSMITLFGKKFSVDGLSVSSGGLSPLSGQLTGTLLDGNTFSLPFLQSNSNQIKLAVVPEPSNHLAFLALGILALPSVLNKVGKRRN